MKWKRAFAALGVTAPCLHQLHGGKDKILQHLVLMMICAEELPRRMWVVWDNSKVVEGMSGILEKAESYCIYTRP